MASTRRPFGPPHGAFDFRDMFFDSSKMEEIRNVQARSLGQMAPGQSRILKRNQTMDEKYLLPKEEALAGTGVRLSLRPPTISSKSRASEALRKLAQIETKILKRRQVPTAWSGMESDSTASERSLPQRTDTTSVSSQYPLRTFQKQVCKTSVVGDDGQSGKGSRFLKKKELPAEARSPVLAAETEKQVLLPTQREPARKYDAPDSDEEEMKVLLGSLMESSGEKERNGNQELPGTRSDLGKVFLDLTPDQPGVLCLLSADQSSLKSTSVSLRAQSLQTRSGGDPASLTTSPSILRDDFSRSASSKRECIKLASSPSRMETESSEEPVSEAAADSLHDFRINILSIDDLVLADGYKSDGEQKGVTTVVEDEEDLTTEHEISEHPGASSTAAVWSHSMSSARSMETPTALSVSPVYSEDFEQFSGPLALEESLDRTLDTLSKFSSGEQTDTVSRQPLSRTEWGRGVTRVVKETAVQTLDPAFAYQWTKEALVAPSTASLSWASWWHGSHWTYSWRWLCGPSTHRQSHYQRRRYRSPDSLQPCSAGVERHAEAAAEPDAAVHRGQPPPAPLPPAVPG
ncbi:uncharacterized protein C19orf44 homolog isoform X2 [Rattus norvegicus]|uniref:uncharacterized protein C19orf44 homolog isoform X2 n=1 Tax=Rattus norvegicus TaxID=10116 RepID=UPI0004E493F2|nr:uncharacterized protein C19orf44 homolog isoform X2 [Rattus norvegicus]